MKGGKTKKQQTQLTHAPLFTQTKSSNKTRDTQNNSNGYFRKKIIISIILQHKHICLDLFHS